MMRVTIPHYIRENFAPGSEPSEVTVRRMLQKKQLPGEKFGGRWYVLVEGTGDGLADEILQKRGLA